MKLEDFNAKLLYQSPNYESNDTLIRKIYNTVAFSPFINNDKHFVFNTLTNTHTTRTFLQSVELTSHYVTDIESLGNERQIRQR